MDRRQLLLAGSAAMGVGALGFVPSANSNPLSLTIQGARHRVLESVTEGMVSLSPDAPPPVIRMRRGQPFVADVTNSLSDYTAMHWHGIRVPNDMDGVPYLTQIPMGQGDAYRYAFTPEDAGTYWYHPHCMTMDQMARGLTGVLIVEEEENPGFDVDLAVNLRDFRLGDDGQFIELYTLRGAARAGTLGSVMTANWRTEFMSDQPSGSLVRLRLAATDTTRIYRLFVQGSEGRIIAMDGHPLNVPVPWPSAEKPLLLSPGQRADLALKMPAAEGQTIDVMAYASGGTHVLARLRAIGADQGRDPGELLPLPPNPLSEPDLEKAKTGEFVFGWSPEGDAPNNGFCGSLGPNFWSINRKPWAGDAVEDTGPLGQMKLGESYILRLRNESPNDHPIHLHGMTFKPIRSNKRDLLPNWTDTALLLRDETIDIALVADNPGDWAFHCHVIEHQKTGLAGYFRVG
ncbi:MAG: multicopper oxidase family protein [Pseudomonadota bacterium]